MTDPLFSVVDRTVLVTGASSGIGLRIAEEFLTRGARVVAASRQAPSAPALGALKDRFGDALLPVAIDLTDPRSTDEVLTPLLDRCPVDVLVNNAGMSSSSPLLAQRAAEWDDVLALNLSAPFRTGAAVAAALVARGAGGSIVNILSIAAFRAIRGLGAYGVSKAGLAQLTRSMAFEFARNDIRVNAVVPGYVRTPMNEDYLAGEGGARTLARIPARRIGEPEDLTGVIVFLASRASCYITGSVIAVDGGFLL